MNFGNPYYGDSNTPQQRQSQSNPSNWNRGWDSSGRSAFQNYLVGRLVFSPDQITPQEIPTDGTPAIFPLDDGSAIYVKTFQPDGTFGEYKYVLEKPKDPKQDAQQEVSNAEPSPDQNVEKSKTYDDLVKRIDFLEQVVNELLKAPKKQPDQNIENKEVEKNGQ